MAITFESLVHSSKSDLATYLQNGVAPSFESLAGWEFRGFNVLSFHEKLVMTALGNVRFIKCFFVDDGVDPARAECLKGYNLKVRNGGLTDPWSTRPSEEAPQRIGHYRVHRARNRPGANPHPHAVFFDYQQPENNLFSGSTIDDYVVMPDPANPDLLLGIAITKIGPLTPKTYFILERYQRHQR